jgi:hypothetical protein
MKKTLLLILGMSIVTHCMAQHTKTVEYAITGIEPDQAVMTFKINQPEPRIGDWIVLNYCFIPLDSLIRSGIDTSVIAVESYTNPCFNMTLMPKDTGLQTIGPLKFSFNGTEYITDTLIVRILPEMKPEPGCSIRFLMMEHEYIVIIDEVRHEHVRYVTVRDSFGRKQKVNRASQHGELAALKQDAMGFCGRTERFSSRTLVPDAYPKTKKSKSWMLYSRSYTFDYSTFQRLEPVKNNFRNLPDNTTITVTDYRQESDAK